MFLVDGPLKLKVVRENTPNTIIEPHKKGDEAIISVAIASVAAKVVRDGIMRELGEQHPEYNWQGNKGYGTPDHIEALQEYGVTSHHRRSFRPIAQWLSKHS